MKKLIYKNIGLIYTLCFFALLLLLPLFSHAQYYLIGQDPASVKWKQIKTKNFQIVFPEEYANIAQYYTNVLEMSSQYVSRPYLDKRPRLSIILHNRSTLSNAMVSPAPMHADFFEMPPQDLYPEIWQDQLALHEYRHVVQMNKLRQGFTKDLYYIFGEQAIAAVYGIFYPFWFIEGDAVFSETVHSNSGRGRVPQFTYPLKAQVLDKRIYPYDKALLGSYKDFVPDYYTLGYQLVTKGIEWYGISLWNKMQNRVARKSFTLVPFTYSLKKTTGKGKIGFYKTVMKSLQSRWATADKQKSKDRNNHVNNRFYVDYLFPQPLSDGSLICEKSGIDNINRFVQLFSNGSEKKLFTPGFDFKESLSANDSLLCWNEKTFDPRWNNRNYSVIKVYNFKIHKLRKISKKSRFFAPAISPDGKHIVTVKVSITGKYSLLILDALTGKTVKSITSSDNLFFETPHWSNDGSYIVTIAIGKKGKAIALVDVATGKIELPMPFSFAEIKWPVMYDSYIVYTGTYEGKDNLYVFNLRKKILFKLRDARFGVTDAAFSADGKIIYFSEYTANGFQPAHIDFHPLELKYYSGKTVRFHYPVDKLVTDTTFVLDNHTVADSVYPVKNYSRLGHLINPYSWGPLSVDADNYSLKPGLTILSQNKLSTAVTTLAWLYDLNEQTGKLQFGFDYYGWYPVVSLKLSYGGRRQYVHNENNILQEVRWNETNLSISTSLPLNFTSGKWIRGIRPSMGYDWRLLQMKKDSKYSFKHDRLSVATVQLYAYTQLKRSPKDIFPRVGLWLSSVFRRSIFSDTVSAQKSIQGAIFLPGVVLHQGLRFYGAYEGQQKGFYTFRTIAAIPRGYANLSYSSLYVFKVDYVFPIVYPDWDVPAVSYLKRIYARLFFDHLRGEKDAKTEHLSSTGVELYSNWHFLSLFPEVELGLRYSYLINTQGNRFEFLYSMNF